MSAGAVRRIALVLAGVAAVIAALAWLTSPAPQRSAGGSEDLGGVLGEGPGAGYARATGPRAFAFPADHGPHPDYRSEWWYVTGNLRTPEGRHFGFQLTFFRLALAPEPRGGPSRWATRQAYMGHFAVTDTKAERFHAHERLARGALDLAGATRQPLAVWLEDWSLRARTADSLFPARLHARGDGVTLDLRLQPGRGPVLNGERGYSRKGPAQGNASYYYSYTRLPASGTLVTPDGRFRVQGRAWLDREWGTSQLANDQAGWDWLALQLDDGSDLMLYRLRRRDGGSDRFSAGTFVDTAGKVQRLDAGDFELTALEHWTSPASGARYPVRWRVRAPALGLRLTTIARLRAQEWLGRFRYWEGAVQVRGTRTGTAITGEGYVELTGY